MARTILVWILSFFVLTIMAALLPMPVAHAASADVVISQVYGGGGNASAPLTHDFVELFNRSSVPVSMNGWSIQYASATGTGNLGANSGQLTELPNVTLQPGQHYLVQEASTAAVGVPLPTPDLIDVTPINMSGTAGKLALVSIATGIGCNGGSAVCNATQLSQILDLVGYGNANFFEGAAAVGTLGNITAATRNNGGCTDTDSNGTDFSVAAPNPRNAASPATPCSVQVLPAISITSVSRSEGNSGTSDFVFTVSLSLPAGASGVSFTISTQPSGTNPAAPGVDYASIAGGSGSIAPAQQQAQIIVQVNGDTPFEPNETFQVVLSGITGATPSTVTGTGTILNDDPSCGAPGATRIHIIQGTLLASGMVGSSVSVEGIVVGDFQGTSKLRGFYLQEEDGDRDSDIHTSEGIFVFDNGTGPDVSLGQKVRVQGTVAEFGGLTEINTVSTAEVCSSGNSVTPSIIHLPLASKMEWEQYEGMLVSFDQPLVATDTFGLERFGEVELAATRLFTPTHVALPGTAAIAQGDLNDRSRIVLDDDHNVQNVFPTSYPQGGLSASNTLRTGNVISGQPDSVTSFVAVLDEAFGAYRLRPVQALFFSATNPRPTPPVVPGRFHVAAFNVLNYFTTLDAGSNTCGPSNLDCRGANTAEEFSHQRRKIIAAIGTLNPDVAGLMELENNTSASLQDITDGLNADAGFTKFGFIWTGTLGTDAIKTGFIYQVSRVTPVGSFQVLDLGDHLNRPALAQDFAPVGSTWDGERFTVVVNHFKSKGSDCNAVGDPDIGDEQGNCNRTRLNMARALTAWLATNPTGSPTPEWDRNVLIIGDLNAYRMEDPVRHLEGAGYFDLIRKYQGDAAYSYVFDGETGYLDHGLANLSFKRRVTGAAEWHINADEPVALDYNVEFKGTGNGMSAAALAAYYSPNAYRSSDHDPLVVGFNPLLGDFNDDGVLDADDRTALLAARGKSGDPRMDLDGDGEITQADFHIWQEYFQSWKQGRYR